MGIVIFCNISTVKKCLLFFIIKDTFLRITVDSGGCSGFLYEFNLENRQNELDICIERNGSRVLIDSESLIFLRGATLDWETSFTKCKFEIKKNPNVENGCGCGVSFTLKEKYSQIIDI